MSRMINGILQHLAFGDLLFTLSIILRTCARVVACMHSLLFLLLSNILSVDEHWSYLQLWALGTRSAKHMCVSLWVDIHFHSLG